MASFLEIIRAVQNLRYNGRDSDTNRLNDRQLAFHINGHRATLLRQQIQKYKTNDNVVQSLGKVKITRVLPGDCCDIQGCFSYKVATKLPTPLEVNGDQMITFVGPTKGKPYQRTNHQRIHWDQHAKYTGKMNKWYMLDGELYLTSPNATLPKYIIVEGIFEDPKAANEYKTCDCGDASTCYRGFDFDYPFPMHLVSAMYDMLENGELSFLDKHPEDTSEDSIDN